jgi:hypothetical protein
VSQGRKPMPYLVISGGFRAKGAQPDGDSVRFAPDNLADWDLVAGVHPVKRNASGVAQLRLDGIDALETHYTPSTVHGCTSRCRWRGQQPRSCWRGSDSPGWCVTATKR